MTPAAIGRILGSGRPRLTAGRGTSAPRPADPAPVALTHLGAPSETIRVAPSRPSFAMSRRGHPSKEGGQ